MTQYVRKNLSKTDCHRRRPTDDWTGSTVSALIETPKPSTGEWNGNVCPLPAD